MPLSDIIKIFGSDEAPYAIQNRFTTGVSNALSGLAQKTIKGVSKASDAAAAAYAAGQPKQEALAADQEGVLRTLLARRMGSNPEELLRSIGNTAFSFIDPNVVAPLARFDVNYDKTARMARGLNPAAVGSTSERLRNSRIASGRYYDVANRAYSALPELYNSAYSQGVNNDTMAGSYIPRISQAFEAVSSRPTTGILNRVNAANQAAGLGGNVLQSILSTIQGYRTPRNFADKFSTALAADEKAVMDIAKMALSAYTGGMMGGGGGGGGGIMSMLGGMGGGGGGGQPSGTPAFGSMYPGAGGGTYQSIPNAYGGGFSQPVV